MSSSDSASPSVWQRKRSTSRHSAGTSSPVSWIGSQFQQRVVDDDLDFAESSFNGMAGRVETCAPIRCAMELRRRAKSCAPSAVVCDAEPDRKRLVGTTAPALPLEPVSDETPTSLVGVVVFGRTVWAQPSTLPSSEIVRIVRVASSRNCAGELFEHRRVSWMRASKPCDALPRSSACGTSEPCAGATVGALIDPRKYVHRQIYSLMTATRSDVSISSSYLSP